MKPKKIPHIYTPEELIDLAFRNASVEARRIKSKDRLLRKRRSEETRVKEASNYLKSYLTTLNKFRDLLDNLSAFQLKLLDITIKVEEIIITLDSFKATLKSLENLERRNKKRMKISKGDNVTLRKEYYGKASSIIKKLKPQFEMLHQASVTIRNLPALKETYTVVIAGMPNVGKSSIMFQITSSKPEIKSYPFTTKTILVGYMEVGFHQIQIIDTPGLLDRPLAERNTAEKRAVLALEELANLILFIFDPTETCGFTFSTQMKLYHEISKNFTNVVPVINKVDIIDEKKLITLDKIFGRPFLKCAAAEGEVTEIRKHITVSQEKENSPAFR